MQKAFQTGNDKTILTSDTSEIILICFLCHLTVHLLFIHMLSMLCNISKDKAGQKIFGTRKETGGCNNTTLGHETN